MVFTYVSLHGPASLSQFTPYDDPTITPRKLYNDALNTSNDNNEN